MLPPEGGQEHPDPLHLQETAVAASAETDPIDFQDMAAEQATCLEIQWLLGPGGSSLKFNFQVIQGHIQACGDRWCRRSTAEQCFNTSMALPTQADLPLIGSFLPGLSGQD
jgi:hypothetical protein